MGMNEQQFTVVWYFHNNKYIEQPGLKENIALCALIIDKGSI